MNQGQRETAQLRRSAEEQITRLLTQLEDLDSLREARGTGAHAPRGLSSTLMRGGSQDLDAEEYESTRAETLKQLAEFNASLSRMMARHALQQRKARADAMLWLAVQAGDVTLVDTLGGMKLAISAAISQAFKTPEVRPQRAAEAAQRLCRWVPCSSALAVTCCASAGHQVVRARTARRAAPKAGAVAAGPQAGQGERGGCRAANAGDPHGVTSPG